MIVKIKILSIVSLTLTDMNKTTFDSQAYRHVARNINLGNVTGAGIDFLKLLEEAQVNSPVYERSQQTAADTLHSTSHLCYR